MVLTKCIQTLVVLKAEVGKLVSFFKAIAEIVNVVKEYHVKDFIDHVTNAKRTYLEIGGYTYTHLQRQIVFNAMLMIRAYFELFKDIASMYVKFDTKHLKGADRLLGDLSMESRDAVENIDGGGEVDPTSITAIKKLLQDWTNTAIDGVEAVVTEVGTLLNRDELVR